MTRRTWPVLLLACAGAAAQAQQGFEQDFENVDKAWREIQAQIPPYPKAENLFPVEGTAASPYRYFLDTASISVDPDGVVRYILVLRTPGGAENVSFEGRLSVMKKHQRYFPVAARSSPDC